MPDFTYKAIDGRGKTRSGDVEASDQAHALTKIAQLGLTPVDLKEGAHEGPWWSRDIQLFGRKSSFQSIDIANFFQTLSTMSEARIPLPRILKLAAGLAQTPAFRTHLERAQSRMQNGQSLAAALKDTEDRFPERHLRLIALAEGSNTLPIVATRVAQSLNRERELRAELRQALVYPIILLIVSLLVGLILVFYLTPTLLPVFSSSGAPPPWIIATMESVRVGLTQYWFVLAILGALLALFALTARNVLSAIWGRIVPRLPGFGPYARDRDFLSFCTALDLMCSSGASVLDGVKAAQGTVLLPNWQTLISDTVKGLQSGDPLSKSLTASPLPDQGLVAMIQAGEQGNRLPDVLPVLCKTLETRARTRLSGAVKLLTPILTLLIGVTVGGVILSTVGAILDLNDALF